MSQMNAGQAAGAGGSEGAVSARSVRRQQLADFWYYFSVNKGAVVGLAVFGLVVLLALFAPLVVPHDPTIQDRAALLVPPAWETGGRLTYLLGTDAVGRDVLSRLIYGARYSMFVGVVVVTITLLVGVILGLVAGYVGGWLDALIMRVMDVILAFPPILLALALVSVLVPAINYLLPLLPGSVAGVIYALGPNLICAMLAIAATYQPHFVRLTRASVLGEKRRDYVTAARVVGARPLRLMFATILPNCLGPLIVQGTLSFSSSILDVAALGFLGVGAQPPTPEWGTMLAEAREFVLRAWWVVTFPGLAILITVLAINLVGDGLRDALDPKLKRS
ncbi:ABC transporter permease subunit [Aureimonas leprariae]|uniref:ABC transporter permease subunit n=1 Tax=Plantimonas leprariae TaxID=2615207 RepID=A0A7V7TWN4_9HYPH|nr:ABC transporter permease subunit [Aureimonas leprariae]KAB0679859.1 ABC transporter permease subunit [Aureimonas leprariae]